MRSEDRNEDDGFEQQPFLAARDRPVWREKESQRSRPSRRQGCWMVTMLLAFVIVTLFSLAALALSFQPVHGQQDAGNHQSDHAGDHGDDHSDQKPGDHTSDVVHYHEDIPDAPQLRDMSEYVLSSSWDVNASPATREYHWVISDADFNPDGVYRPMKLINNQFPGPLFECNDGDTIVVNVQNSAVNATSIHFHGLFQNGTNAMDGAVGVTQCAIAPGSSFTYRFEVREQSGTYWYHAHHSAQASDGLLGPVIIHSKDEKSLQEMDYATDRIIMVQDHYHNTTSELLMDYLQPDKENEEPVPDNALINGRGSRDCNALPGWRCDSSQTSTPTFDLEAGQRHRLRIINVGAFAEFQIQFDEHPFYVTEADGTDVHPEPFHRLNIMPAQRYSIILETNSTSAQTFWLRARMITFCFKGSNDNLEPEIRGVVRYTSPGNNAVDVIPTSKDWTEAGELLCRDLNASLLHPVQHISPPPADDFITLRAAFHIGAWRLARGFINETTWLMNATHPSLHRFLDAEPEVKTLDKPLAINDLAFDQSKEFVLQTSGIRTVDIAINNFDDGSHPFHLHGHKFFVLIEGLQGYPPSAADLPLYIARNRLAENPLRRDTVTVGGFSWAIIRVVLDNPGLWLLHCHTIWHAESGMSMQFLVRGDVVRGWGVDPAHRQLCRREGAATGLRPDDSIWFGSGLG